MAFITIWKPAPAVCVARCFREFVPNTGRAGAPGFHQQRISGSWARRLHLTSHSTLCNFSAVLPTALLHLGNGKLCVSLENCQKARGWEPCFNLTLICISFAISTSLKSCLTSAGVPLFFLQDVQKKSACVNGSFSLATIFVSPIQLVCSANGLRLHNHSEYFSNRTEFRI